MIYYLDGKEVERYAQTGILLQSPEHEHDGNSHLLEISIMQSGRQLKFDSEVAATAAVTLNGVLLHSNLPCVITSESTIQVPVDAEELPLEAGILSFEISVTGEGYSLTLPYPIQFSVRESVLRTAQISGTSQGTIPELLAAKADREEVYTQAQADGRFSTAQTVSAKEDSVNKFNAFTAQIPNYDALTAEQKAAFYPTLRLLYNRFYDMDAVDGVLDSFVIRSGKLYYTDTDGVEQEIGAVGGDGYTKSETDSLLAQKLDKTADISAVVLAAARTLQPLPVSSTSDMTDTNRLYVYNGTLWQYREVAVPGYTNLVDTAGWNTGYRLNSSGKLAALSGSSVSNFIPAKSGDILRVKGWNFTLTPQYYSYIYGYPSADETSNTGAAAVSTNAIGTSNASFAYEKVKTLADGTLQYTLALNNSDTNKMPNTCNYIRISGTSPANLDNVIITINEPITGDSTTAMQWVDTGISYSGSCLSNDVAALEDRVDDAEDGIDALETRVASLESGVQSVTVPSYWESAVSAAETTVRELQDAAGYDAVNFVFFSDMHIDSDGTNYAHRIGVLARRVMDDLQIPVCLNAGDLNNRSSESTKSAVTADIEAAKEILAPIESGRLLTCRGNHDLYYGSDAYTKGFSHAEVYNLLYRGQATDIRRVFGGDTYYYVDDTAHKMRYIVLDCHKSEYTVSTDGSMSFDAYHKNGYGNAQLNWLAGKALALPAGWTAAIVQHCPPTYGYAKDSNGYGIRDLSVFVGIVNAYCNRTSYTGSYAHDDNNGEGDWADVSVSCNFASASGWLCGIFCGHRHTDNIYTSPTACPIFVITCAKSGSSANENTRTYGTDTETALDIVTVNRATREVTLTRLGVRSTDSHDSDGNRSYPLNS